MSDDKQNVSVTFHQRWLDFTHTFGNEGYFEDGLVASMKNMHDLCRIFFGEEAAARGFNRIVRGGFPQHGEYEPWDEILDDEFSSIYSDTRIGQLAHDLTAYAQEGIVLLTATNATQREDWLSQQIEAARTILDLLPVDHWKLREEHLIKVFQKAEVRWKIDTGEPINARELALLSNRALQTIKNKLAKNSREIEGTEKVIEAREALLWLETQKDFKTSIWREQEDTIADEAPEDLGKVFFVPIAKDGSLFHPGIHREGKYLIDLEGREQAFEDFHAALAVLHSMRFPQWRRPTSEGVWTRVRGVEWRRYTWDELSELTG
ncbi:hypothetical protein [Phaeobacter gallaeciensis]|uniref:hypothetical protein n=1 Tax=Phaeobacter gallaeciensis TaxID=60890 RepID=UPI00237F9448|nr:hypothetical protein [Phaeobacter gallaeciensis]MDE4139982.1 hypothetical protein [Phaeobacter gallaeciensis]MDE4148408.1 hypothetical protein [Phaeobacter gallaeciensis]MDE4152648.1 hypothetical protein [Phaeobacter gallaeciensis]MDE4228018.1 hypothetical protein [Phaeobacter gallaeciensis]MDE4257113.1 hypothetical protein [Phaeobacter gallaeciensis]